MFIYLFIYFRFTLTIIIIINNNIHNDAINEEIYSLVYVLHSNADLLKPKVPWLLTGSPSKPPQRVRDKGRRGVQSPAGGVLGSGMF